MSKVAVIVAAAGKGERFGQDERKTFARLDGRPVFLRTLEKFINRDDVCKTILVVASDDVDEVKQKFGPNLGFMGVTLVEGGKERVESVEAGLKAVPEDADLVAVHDAARPCVSDAMIDAVFAEATKSGAAILAAPLTGTIKRAADSESGKAIEATVSRENLYEAQTPQVFRLELLLRAFANTPEDKGSITDDAGLVELLGEPVAIVESDSTNLKITKKSDMLLANAIIKATPAKVVSKFGAFEEGQW
ncbi:MAG: 2-C-methyl-D-erythritol 4-phosphate cytidylyltransferase [Planctomycetes bacterium]|nr:2-C-methyl-D-erythritol 4-phosphate cytidylyltransferase [Planctomycetota bacterium]